MIYTGIDIVEIERIEQAVRRWGDRFLRRVFTAAELRDADAQPRSLAARWAAKEAAAKALGVGVSGPGAVATVGAGMALRWQEIEVSRPAGQPPRLVLHGAAARRAAALGWREVALSLSHSRAFAVALVVAAAADDA